MQWGFAIFSGDDSGGPVHNGWMSIPHHVLDFTVSPPFFCRDSHLMGMKSAWNRGFRQYNNGWQIQQKPGSQLYTVYME